MCLCACLPVRFPFLQLCSPTVLTSPRSTLRKRILRQYMYINVQTAMLTVHVVFFLFFYCVARIEILLEKSVHFHEAEAALEENAEGHGCHASVNNCFMYFLWRSAIGVSQLTNQRGCFRCTVVQSFASCFYLFP